GFVIALAAPLAAVYASYEIASDTLREQEFSRLEAIASSQMQRIEAQVESNLERIERLSNQMRLRASLEASLGAPSDESREQLITALDRIVSGHFQILDVQLILKKGETLESNPGPRSGFEPPDALVHRALRGPTIYAPEAANTPEFVFVASKPIW